MKDEDAKEGKVGQAGKGCKEKILLSPSILTIPTLPSIPTLPTKKRASGADTLERKYQDRMPGLKLNSFEVN